MGSSILANVNNLQLPRIAPSHAASTSPGQPPSQSFTQGRAISHSCRGRQNLLLQAEINHCNTNVNPHQHSRCASPEPTTPSGSSGSPLPCGAGSTRPTTHPRPFSAQSEPFVALTRSFASQRRPSSSSASSP